MNVRDKGSVRKVAGADNLKLIKSTEEARIKGRNGGIRSGEVRKARKTLKEELLLLLAEGDTQKNITLALLTKAMKGDTKAFEVLRDSIGEKCADKQEVNLIGNANIDIGFDNGKHDKDKN